MKELFNKVKEGSKKIINLTTVVENQKQILRKLKESTEIDEFSLGVQIASMLKNQYPDEYNNLCTGDNDIFIILNNEIFRVIAEEEDPGSIVEWLPVVRFVPSIKLELEDSIDEKGGAFKTLKNEIIKANSLQQLLDIQENGTITDGLFEDYYDGVNCISEQSLNDPDKLEAVRYEMLSALYNTWKEYPLFNVKKRKKA